MQLGPIGVWSGALRNGEPGAMQAAAVELEELGYGTIWFPGGPPAGLAEHILGLLERTQRVVVATGIVNIWTHPADRIAAQHHTITQAYPGRFLLGIGVSHEGVVAASGLKYERPFQKMVEYLDALDTAQTPV